MNILGLSPNSFLFLKLPLILDPNNQVVHINHYLGRKALKLKLKNI